MAINYVVPLWSIILFLISFFGFVIKTYIDFEKLKDRVKAAETKLDSGDVKFTKIQDDLHSMSNVLTEIHTKLNIYLERK